jgi:hypothetical protein
MNNRSFDRRRNESRKTLPQQEPRKSKEMLIDPYDGTTHGATQYYERQMIRLFFHLFFYCIMISIRVERTKNV